MEECIGPAPKIYFHRFHLFSKQCDTLISFTLPKWTPDGESNSQPIGRMVCNHSVAPTTLW